MKKFKGLMTSLSPYWATPKWLYETLDQEFAFNDDPCPLHSEQDGLLRSWGSSTFINPPYGRVIGDWVKKGFEEAQSGKTVVMLLPARTDTRWFHDYVLKAKEIRWIKGRLKFGEAVNSAPFPSMIVVFKITKMNRS
jgi:site-specific DNA-methyltransferase (adenine-specific)